MFVSGHVQVAKNGFQTKQFAGGGEQTSGLVFGRSELGKGPALRVEADGAAGRVLADYPPFSRLYIEGELFTKEFPDKTTGKTVYLTVVSPKVVRPDVSSIQIESLGA